MKKFIFFAAIIVFAIVRAVAQVGINANSSAPDPSAGLDVNFDNKGLLPPRVALTAINSSVPVAAPAVGLLVYNTATAGTAPNNVVPGYYYWNGIAWTRLAAFTSGSGEWSLLGNAGTVAGTNFIGTADNQAFDIRTNNALKTRITIKGAIETYNTGQSVLVGEGAGANDDVTNNQNVFVGYQAGNANTSGYSNVAVGNRTLYNNTDRTNIVAVGDSALFNNGVGVDPWFGDEQAFENTAIGSKALFSNTTGFRNTATGFQALYSNTTGKQNTAVGKQALFFNTYGNWNTAFGEMALYSNTNIQNTAIGRLALYSNTTGSNNTAIGTYADVTSGNLTNATAIGFNAKVSQSNSLVLGSTDSYAVNVGIGTRTPSAKLDVIGAVKITDGSQGLNKVLTSDANGLASWQTPQSSSNSILNQTSVDQSAGFRINGNGLFNGGKVGIGTTNPSVAMEVSGDVKIKHNPASADPFTIETLNSMIDQANTIYDGTIRYGDIWQSFTANVSGNLFRVSIYDNHQYCSEGTWTLYHGTGIGGSVIASGPYIFDCQEGIPPFYEDINIAGSPFLTKNEIYTFRMTNVGWLGNASNVYAGGQNNVGGDQCFKTYLNTSNYPAVVVKENSYVGIGTSNPTVKLEVNGQLKITDGTQALNKVLTSDDNGMATWKYLSSSSVSGNGTTNYLAKWTSSNNLGIGNICINEQNHVGINTQNPLASLHIEGYGDFPENVGYAGNHVAYIHNSGANTPGGADGLYIMLSTNDYGSHNNFITFAKAWNDERGRIEGFKTDDWSLDPFNLCQLSELGFGQLGYLASLECNNNGVAYCSGSGDYAEFLERENHDEDYRFGMVVGVKGGKVSLNTTDAEQVMVVSAAPVVLGNLPPNRDEEKNFEKIAFMGQVPVIVLGPVHSGDYLVPTGKENGTAMAVSPDNLQIKDVRKIIGRSWETNLETGGKFVLAVVGIKTNEIVDLVEKKFVEFEEMNTELKQLKSEIAEIRSTIGLAVKK
ncbi:MAG: hypothetical protein NT040_18145 [Bacteroidetes bacterium]|nr:hypothetical protein [Bacteroidota bacterium]